MSKLGDLFTSIWKHLEPREIAKTMAQAFVKSVMADLRGKRDELIAKQLANVKTRIARGLGESISPQIVDLAADMVAEELYGYTDTFLTHLEADLLKEADKINPSDN